MKRLIALTSATLLLAACGARTITAPDTLATLNVLVQGLPAGQAADVTVHGPDASAIETIKLTGAQTLRGLPPGHYTVDAAPVSANGLTLSPTVDVPSVQFDVQHMQQDVHVTYAAPATGSLTVNVAGVPNGSQATLHLKAPDGSVRTLTGLTTQTLAGLAPGTYTLTADVVGTGTGTFSPSVDPASVTVMAGRSVVANVSYFQTSSGGGTSTPTTPVNGGGGSPTPPNGGTTTPTIPAESTGALSVQVTGLPGNATYSLSVTDSAGHTRAVIASTVLTDLPPGTYRVSAQDLLIGDVRYHTNDASSTVVAGQSASLQLTFVAVSGALTVAVNSPVPVPEGLIQVTGPAGTSSLQHTSTLPDIQPGTYTVTAQAFTQGGYTYTPLVTPELLSVQAGLTAGATIIYQPNAVQVGVTTDVTPPTVSLNTDPTGTYTSLTGTAQDTTGPVSVQVFDGTTLVGTVNQVNGPWQLAWPAPGPHQLTAIATDAAGNSAQTSATINVTAP